MNTLESAPSVTLDGKTKYDTNVLISGHTRRGDIRLVRRGLKHLQVQIFAPLAGTWQDISGYGYQYLCDALPHFQKLEANMNRPTE